MFYKTSWDFVVSQISNIFVFYRLDIIILNRIVYPAPPAVK